MFLLLVSTISTLSAHAITPVVLLLMSFSSYANIQFPTPEAFTTNVEEAVIYTFPLPYSTKNSSQLHESKTIKSLCPEFALWVA